MPSVWINFGTLYESNEILHLFPPQRFPRVFRGGEEQARELNLLEDWGREWWGGGGSRYVGVCPGEYLPVFKLQRLECLQ